MIIVAHVYCHASLYNCQRPPAVHLHVLPYVMVRAFYENRVYQTHFRHTHTRADCGGRRHAAIQSSTSLIIPAIAPHAGRHLQQSIHSLIKRKLLNIQCSTFRLLKQCEVSSSSCWSLCIHLIMLMLTDSAGTVRL